MKRYLRNGIGWLGLDLSGSGWEPVADSGKHGNGFSGSIWCGGYLE
jgi:hypothetical protein